MQIRFAGSQLLRPRWFVSGMVLTVVLIAASFALDAPVGNWARDLPKEAREVAGKIGEYGDWPYLMAYALFFWVLATLGRSPSLRKLLVCMMLASTLAGIAGNAARLTTGRTRPSIPPEKQGFYGLRHEGEWLIGRYKYNSFPSGHTATAVGFFTPLLLSGPAGAVLAGLALVWIPLARLATLSHHFSDVIAGAFVGFWSGLILCHRLYPPIAARWGRIRFPRWLTWLH